MDLLLRPLRRGELDRSGEPRRHVAVKCRIDEHERDGFGLRERTSVDLCAWRRRDSVANSAPSDRRARPRLAKSVVRDEVAEIGAHADERTHEIEESAERR